MFVPTFHGLTLRLESASTATTIWSIFRMAGLRMLLVPTENRIPALAIAYCPIRIWIACSWWLSYLYYWEESYNTGKSRFISVYFTLHEIKRNNSLRILAIDHRVIIIHGYVRLSRMLIVYCVRNYLAFKFHRQDMIYDRLDYVPFKLPD